MPTVTILIGLPGSGKSEYLKSAHQRGEPTFDDFHANAIENSHAFENSRQRDPLKAALAAGKDCRVSDIAFCNAAHLRSVIAGIIALGCELGTPVTVELLYFANDPLACKDNVQRRNRDSLPKELAMIEALTTLYVIPPGARTLPVWTPTERQSPRTGG